MYWEKRRELILGRSPVFRAGPNWNASHGRRQRAEPGPRSKGPSGTAGFDSGRLYSLAKNLKRPNYVFKNSGGA